MSVENPDNGPSESLVTMDETKMVNGERVNGVSNGHSSNEKHRSSSSGHHKSSSKDKHRDKDRDKDKDREHKSSKSSHSSSSKDKHSSSSSSHKDKDRDKTRDKDKPSSSSHKSSSHDKDRKDRDKDKNKEKHSSSGSNKDRDKDKSRDKDKEKDKSRDKDRDKNRDKDKERSKEHKSSNTDKDKEKSSSSRDKDKDKESRDKDKESRDKDKDRYKSSSSSSSAKKHSSSSSSSRNKDKDRDKERHSSSKSSSRDKHKDRQDEIKKEIDIKVENKEEPYTKLTQQNSVAHGNIHNYNVAVKKEEIKEEPENFNISQASSCDYSMSQFRDDEESFKMKDPLLTGDNDESQDCDYNNTYNSTQPDDDDDDDGGGGGGEQDETAEAEDDDEDIPIAKRKMIAEPSDEEDVPLTARKKIKTSTKPKKAKKKKREDTDEEYDDYDEEERPKKKKVKKEKKKEEKPKTIKKEVINQSPTKGGRKKKEEEPQEVWKWWEEEKKQDGTKWGFLEHKGPVFAPPYERIPEKIQFEYDGKVVRLSEPAEEIACFYAKMLEHDYTGKKVFNDNFFKDWRKSMTSKEREKITNLKLCNFRKMHAYFQDLSERNKQRTKEEKAAIKAENEMLISEYGFCTIDGHKEKIGNFKIEPPGLFRGRGEHPKMGMVKNRIQPEDVMINCSKDSKIPVPPSGHKWKDVRHDNTVTWLASWSENVQGQVKYVMLNPSSKLKGEKDWQKYETARKLHRHIDKIRNTYREEWKSKEMRIRQRGVALYFIDKLALRAGNEKDEDQADTVGCCSLRVEHIELHKHLNGKENVVVFDFLGKDSIRYYNEVEVEKRVFKNLELFKENKKAGDDLFDRLNTVVMNEHLRELMEGLTAKVFRTYNASWTLQNQLQEMTDPDASLPEKLLAYNRANRAVAILCNHQRAVPKSHEKSMENLKEKIRAKREQLDDLEVETVDAVRAAKRGSMKEKINADKKKKTLERCKEQLKKLELQETDRDENKTIALGTSKLNYLDPRITVAWCKKHEVPIDKIYNKTQRDKFRWAIDMATEDYIF